jgi:3-oxoacyl-[acyl-carrier protein] reductase
MPVPDSGPADLAGRVALVTGAAGDIGQTTCRVLAAAGARVVGTDIVDAFAGFADTPAIGYVRQDVTSRADTERVVADVVARHGRLDILALAAGIATSAPIDAVEDDDWQRMFDINVYGVMNTIRAAWPTLRAQGSGKIVAFGSVAGRIGGLKSGPAYSASKGAVHALVKQVAKYGAPLGIHANAIAPGPIDASMWNDDLHGGAPPDPATYIPLGRAGTTSDIAHAVLFLASPQSNWITGKVLDVNGGFLMV